MKKTTGFGETLRGKIILAFVLIGISVALMWTVNKVAFKKITSIVRQLSEPNEKLTIARELSLEVANLPNLQQSEVRKEKETTSITYARSTREIRQNIDSLRNLLIDEPLQLSRLDSISSFFKADNKLFLDYLKLSYEIEQKKSFETQLDVLSQKMDSQKVQIDSNVVTNEKKIKTTTVVPIDTIEIPQKQSWLKKIFSKPKTQTIVIPGEPQVVVEEEVKTKIDTLSVARTDSSLPKLGRSLRRIERKRVQRLGRLQDSEEKLLKANNVLIGQIQNLLHEFEKQEVEQVKSKTEATVYLATKTIGLTRAITIALVVIALFFAMLMIIDVTKSRRYRRELEAAKAEADYHSTAKQRFLANMSHEIRTPLQSIIGYSELELKAGKGNNSIDAIHSSAKHLLHIVNEVLDYSRITSGKFTFENLPFSVTGVTKEVLSAVHLLAAKKSLKLEFAITGLNGLDDVVGDSFRLKQILFNLLGNAIKFTEAGYVKLTVSGTRRDDKVLLSFVVEDTGIGMTEKDLKYIFNQFEQVGDVDKRNSGTGLGLTIAKDLAEAQRGHIAVESEPGKGSKFTVEIPFEIATKKTAAVVEDGEVTLQQFNGKVWLVDDDELILRLTSTILTRHGIPHSCFSTSEQVLNEPWDDKVKIVFCDIRLPGLSGLDVCRFLRKKASAETRIVALTAQVLPEEKDSVLKGGFNDLLHKPFTAADLLRVVYNKADQQGFVQKFDLSKLEQMVGDKEQLGMILKQCYEDTTDDLEQLAVAIKEGDPDTANLIIHRLAGRIGQVGDTRLAARLRKTEAAIRRENNLEAFKGEMEVLLSEINHFLIQLENEVEAEV